MINPYKQSELLYNDELKHLFAILKDISNTEQPTNGIYKSLWLNNKGELKYLKDGLWQNIFDSKFRIISELLSQTAPVNPFPSQLWIDDGTLCYYNGYAWEPIKANISLNSSNDMVFENFLYINSLENIYEDKVFEPQNDYINTRYKTILSNDIQTVYYDFDRQIDNLLIELYENGYMIFNDDYEVKLTNITKENKVITRVSLTKKDGKWLKGSRINLSMMSKKIDKKNNNILTAVMASDSTTTSLKLNEAISKNEIVYDLYLNGLLQDEKDYVINFSQGVEGSNTVTTIKIDKQFKKNDKLTLRLTTKNIQIQTDDDDNHLFAVPSYSETRIFADGYHLYPKENYYKPISNICVKFENDSAKDKILSAIRINSKKLISMNKKIIIPQIINGEYMIPSNTINKEFYLFYGGSGVLLNEDTEKEERDYKSTSNGIVLNKAMMTSIPWDFVLCIEYEFSNNKTSGKVFKREIESDGGSSIYIGQTEKDLAVMVQGFFINHNEYIYDKSTGFIKLNLPSKLHVAAIEFNKKEEGKITSTSGGVINIALKSKYAFPLLFLGNSQQGVTYNKMIPEFTYNRTSNIITVNNLTAGVEYCYGVLESYIGPGLTNEQLSNQSVIDGIDPRFNLTICSGTCNDNTITDSKLNYDILPVGEEMLFVNGLYISRDLIKRSSNNSIEVQGIKAGQKYVILKNKDNNSILYDGFAEHSTIGFNDIINASLLYVENRLVCDTNTLPYKKEDRVAIQGEIKTFYEGNKEIYKMYKTIDNILKWYTLSEANTEEKKIIDKVKASTDAYTTSNKTINISKDFSKNEVYAYAYKYANAVGQKVFKNNITCKFDKDENFIPFSYQHGKTFIEGFGRAALYINGIRQDDITECKKLNSSSTAEKSYYDYGISINGKILNPITGEADQLCATYIIEPLVSGATKCNWRKILTYKNKVAGTIYQLPEDVDFSLNDGYLRVYVNGIRQARNNYKIINDDKIIFSETIDESEYFVNKFQSSERILIEVSTDYDIKEQSFIKEVNKDYTGMNIDFSTVELSLKEDGLSESIFDSNNEINIYVDGILYTGEYNINNINKTIELSKNDVMEASFMGRSIKYNDEKTKVEFIVEWRR